MADTPSSPAEPRNDKYDTCSRCGHSRWLHQVTTDSWCSAKSVRGALKCQCPAFVERPAPSSGGETPAAQDGRTHSESCWTEHHDCARAEIARLCAEVERWQRAFRSFADHRADCPRFETLAGWCDCGYSALIRKLNAAATPPAGDARGS